MIFFEHLIKFGIDKISFSLPKFFLILFFSVKDNSMHYFTSKDVNLKFKC